MAIEVVDMRLPALPRISKGSVLRLGNSVVASGTEAGYFEVEPGDPQDITIRIVEDCHLDRLVIQTDGQFIVTKIAVDNDGHLNFAVPASIFAHDSLASPQFGHFVTKNSTITLTVRNVGAEKALISAGFTAMIGDSR